MGKNNKAKRNADTNCEVDAKTKENKAVSKALKQVLIPEPISKISQEEILKSSNSFFIDEEGIIENKKISKVTKKARTNESCQEELVSLIELKGYKVLPVHISGLASSSHQFFIKLHKPTESTLNDPSLPEQRTIFIYNLPIDLQSSDLVELFQLPVFGGKGSVVKVKLVSPTDLNMSQKQGQDGEFSKKVTPTAKKLQGIFPLKENKGQNGLRLLCYPSFAYVVFKTVESLQSVMDFKAPLRTDGLALSKLPKLQLKATRTADSGIDRWMQTYDISRPDSDILQAYVDEYMGEYHHHQELQTHQANLAHDLPDDDGFVTVTKGKGTNFNAGANVRAITKAEAKHLGSQLKEGHGQPLPIEKFYRFQSRHSKASQLADLRAQFEADKKKILELKQNKQFQPL